MVKAELEEGLRAAVRGFVASMDIGRPVIADMSMLVQATENLPLSQFAHWEGEIREAFDRAWDERAAAERTGWRATTFAGGRRARNRSARPMAWIDLNSWDGHERERTLRTLSGPAPNSFFLAMAARRLNDWVPQVRAAAREAVPRLALASDPEHVADTLCAMLPEWTAWGRVEDADRQVVLSLFTNAGVPASLMRRLLTSAAGPMPAVLTQALRTPALDGDLVQIAAEAVQPSVRARAYRALLSGKAVWVESQRWQWTDISYCQGQLENVLGERPLTTVPEQVHTLASVANDRSSIVRRVAADVLVREMNHLGDRALALARQLAQDPSPRVAERGAFVLAFLTAGKA